MNILFIANRFPYPPYRGDKLKIFNLAKRLSKKHTLYLLTFIQDKKDYKFIPELRNYFDKLEVIYLPKYLSVFKCAVKIFSPKPFQITYFESNRFKKLVNNFIANNEIDVIHTQHLRMSQYSVDIKHIKRILDLPDAYSLYWERRANLKRNIFQKIFDNIEFSKVLKYEEIIKKFDLNLVCSDEDKQFLVNSHKIDTIKILPNGVDLDTFKSEGHDYTINDKLIFTGNMDYAPNVDAVCYFVKEIFPIILSKFPETKFYIVGQRPVSKVLSLQSENVIVKGFVENLAVEYKKCAVAVSPVRIGAGTLNKVLEPMALGIPVVTTNVGFKGLCIEPGVDALLANNTSEFAYHVTELLGSEAKRRTIGNKGKEAITTRFSWDSISSLLESFFEKLTRN
ncbi:MAG: glycosyltransferase [Ignavibacteriae bacterium]|nr:MAG: glycosyltransferase [Ignavibacteriota bacterium]